MGRLRRGILLSLALLVSLSLLGVTSCVHAINDTLQSGFGPSDHWSGPVEPIGSNCGNRATGLMTLGSNAFSFDPFGSIIVIQGKVKKDNLEGSDSQAAPGQKGITIQFAGTINRPAGGRPVIQGVLKSGTCTWAVTLHRD